METLTDRRLIFEAVDRERDHQDRKYGPLRRHEIPGWLVIMEREIQEVKEAWADGDITNAVRELLQVTSVGIAALEQHGVIER